MRKIETFSADYIALQKAIAEASDLSAIELVERYEGIQAAAELLTEDEAGRLNFIYNEDVEEILSIDYTEVLAEFSREIFTTGEMSLDEAINFVTLSKTADCENISEDDLENIRDVFGEENFDIPASNDGAYRVTLNAIGKGKAIKCLRKLQSEISDSSDIVRRSITEGVNSQEFKNAIVLLTEAAALHSAHRGRLERRANNLVAKGHYVSAVASTKGVRDIEKSIAQNERDAKRTDIKNNLRLDLHDVGLNRAAKREVYGAAKEDMKKVKSEYRKRKSEIVDEYRKSRKELKHEYQLNKALNARVANPSPRNVERSNKLFDRVYNDNKGNNNVELTPPSDVVSSSDVGDSAGEPSGPHKLELKTSKEENNDNTRKR